MSDLMLFILGIVIIVAAVLWDRKYHAMDPGGDSSPILSILGVLFIVVIIVLGIALLATKGAVSVLKWIVF